MMPQTKVRVAVNGYGVTGKRVADAIALQDDIALVGISDVAADWRTRIVTRKGFGLYGATKENARAMEQAGLQVAGTLDELLHEVDVMVDCTPKKFGAENAEAYRRAGIKFITQGGRACRRRPLLRCRSQLRERDRARSDAHCLKQYNIDSPHVDCAEAGGPLGESSR